MTVPSLFVLFFSLKYATPFIHKPLNQIHNEFLVDKGNEMISKNIHLKDRFYIQQTTGPCTTSIPVGSYGSTVIWESPNFTIPVPSNTFCSLMLMPMNAVVTPENAVGLFDPRTTINTANRISVIDSADITRYTDINLHPVVRLFLPAQLTFLTTGMNAFRLTITTAQNAFQITARREAQEITMPPKSITNLPNGQHFASLQIRPGQCWFNPCQSVVARIMSINLPVNESIAVSVVNPAVPPQTQVLKGPLSIAGQAFVSTDEQSIVIYHYNVNNRKIEGGYTVLFNSRN